MHKVAAAAERTVQICAVLLSTVYLVSGLVYLCLGYWNVTQRDYWRIYEICLNHSWLQSALLKFNGHSMFFPSFIWLADLRFFHGNQGLLFFVSLALLLISTSLLLVPVWRDRAVELTAKLLASLTVIVASFWMGRASITASGGYNCMTSLVMLGVASAFLLLPRMCAGSRQFWRTTAIIVCAGFVASFSFGAGLAIWPSLLLLGWCLRLPWRSLGPIAAAGIVAALVYHLLPPPEESYVVWGSTNSPGLFSIVALGNFCKLVGSPLFSAVMAWQGTKTTNELIQSSGWLVWGGTGGVALATAVAIPRLIRRDLKGNSLEFTGLLLITFNLCALALVVAGRVDYLREHPADVASPRYLFWSSLFWAGLLTVAISYWARAWWLRWPIVLIVLVFPAILWARHLDQGFHTRYVRMLAEEAATGLINGVNDPKGRLYTDAKQIDLLSPQLRANRLDMFAEGLQDWIGQPVSKLFGGRRDPSNFRGRAVMERLLHGEDDTDAVRITGQIFVQKEEIPATMVIVDPQGIVAGIARSFATNAFLNRLFYGGRMPNNRLAGYIRNYNPAFQYVIRSAGDQGVSEQTIAVAPFRR